MTTPSLLDRARDAMDIVVREMVKFGAVGAIAFLVDVGTFNLLRFGLGDGGPLESKPITAKVVSVAQRNSERAQWHVHLGGAPDMGRFITEVWAVGDRRECAALQLRIAQGEMEAARPAVAHVDARLHEQHVRERRP